MTTQVGYRDSREIAKTVAERDRQLDELRAAMREREGMQPGTPQHEAALAHEAALLERIHEWALGSPVHEQGGEP